MRVCLIGATHPCHNPRLVREADTLTDAGHQCGLWPMSFASFGGERPAFNGGRKWRLQQIDFRPTGIRSRWRAFLIRGRRRAASFMPSLVSTGFTSSRARNLLIRLALPELKRFGGFEPADWFIAPPRLRFRRRVAAQRRMPVGLIVRISSGTAPAIRSGSSKR